MSRDRVGRLRRRPTSALDAGPPAPAEPLDVGTPPVPAQTSPADPRPGRRGAGRGLAAVVVALAVGVGLGVLVSRGTADPPRLLQIAASADTSPSELDGTRPSRLVTTLTLANLGEDPVTVTGLVLPGSGGGTGEVVGPTPGGVPVPGLQTADVRFLVEVDCSAPPAWEPSLDVVPAGGVASTVPVVLAPRAGAAAGTPPGPLEAACRGVGLTSLPTGVLSATAAPDGSLDVVVENRTTSELAVRVADPGPADVALAGDAGQVLVPPAGSTTLRLVVRDPRCGEAAASPAPWAQVRLVADRLDDGAGPVRSDVAFADLAPLAAWVGAQVARACG